MPRSLLLALAALLTLAGGAQPARAELPPVKHVFVIVLENKGYEETFGPHSPALYLSRELRARGQLLTRYHGIAHLSLPNYLAMVSGQGPNITTQADCPVYQDVKPGTQGSDGQAMGNGCVYPPWVKTVADQLEERGLTWKGYMEDMGTPCRHPVPGRSDPTQSARVGDQYATRHNPFVYFHSILDRPSCAANDVPLERLVEDLRSAATTPSYAFITPNLCNDGHDEPCVDGKPGGLVSADEFLRTWVPRILGSPAYRGGGLLVITFDEAEAGGGSADASACCGQISGNTPNAGGPVIGPGGGRTGALLLSPYIKPGTENPTPYNHYAFLRSVEDLFGLGHLGYAARPGLRAFGEDVFDGPRCFNRPLPPTRARKFPRGTLIASARIKRRPGRTTLLEVEGAHAADLWLRANGRRIGPRRLRACETIRVGLGAGHGRVTVGASVRAGSERRTLAF